ncbi:hypothetical protein QBC35DRAFT_509643 [Podospora australis]|uniref:Uncharacterized protein n=1 Tax=Podospora australis TaxID=1536484 RepID=A0AAN6WLP5_9PEZI|nr:hypothetical protein QBC35DRAFT_509643 [Podospora australis]
MANSSGVSASSFSLNHRPLTSNHEELGVFSRLLQRTRSTKGSQRASQRTRPVSNNVTIQEEPKDPNHTLTPVIPTYLPDTSGIPTSADAQQQEKVDNPMPSVIQQQTSPALEMPNSPPQPQLKRKTSFRDRFKTWQKPAPTLEIIEEPKPRFVYEPKHAAADFSRMPVSPVAGQQHPLISSRSITVLKAAAPGEAAVARHSSQSRPKRHDESVPRVATENASRQPQQKPQDQYPQHQGRTSEPLRKHSKRHSYTMAEHPFEATQAAVHIPLRNMRPVGWIPGSGPERSPSFRRDQSRQQPRSEPTTDFEQFIAEAEAKERATREQILRNLSLRSAAAQLAPGHVQPNPHQQFALAGSSSAEMSAATTAVAPKSGGSATRSSTRCGGRGSGSHHRNSGHYALSGTEQQPQQQQQPRQQQTSKKSHARNSSWAPSYNTGSSSDEMKLVKTPMVFEVNEGVRRSEEHQNQPIRTLRRQASITQRIAEYIRPPRPSAGAGEPQPGYVPRTVSKRMVHPIETLVE